MKQERGFVWVVVLIVVALIAFFVWKRDASAPTPAGDEATTTASATVTEAPAKTTQTSGTVGTVTKPTSQTAIRTPSGAYIVSYTNNGFAPSNVYVPVRSTVHFVNNSNSSMSIVTIDEKNAPYNTLNQGKSVGKGGVFDFAFVQAGAYGYYNLNNKTHTGIVVVQ